MCAVTTRLITSRPITSRHVTSRSVTSRPIHQPMSQYCHRYTWVYNTHLDRWYKSVPSISDST